jgi:hypothetical protein
MLSRPASAETVERQPGPAARIEPMLPTQTLNRSSVLLGAMTQPRLGRRPMCARSAGRQDQRVSGAEPETVLDSPYRMFATRFVPGPLQAWMCT